VTIIYITNGKCHVKDHHSLIDLFKMDFKLNVFSNTPASYVLFEISDPIIV